MADTYTFPSHLIDPRDKNFEWILQFCKAAWSVGSNNSLAAFYTNAIRYREIRDYALGKQSISKYRKITHPERQTDKSPLNIDGTVVPIIPQFRNKSIAKLLQREFDINAYAVDEQAQTEQDQSFKKMMIKIAMRQQLQTMNSPLAQHPAVQRQTGEPIDNDQLMMMAQFGWKHDICMDAEMAIDWMLNYNQFDKERHTVIADCYDFGAGGYKVYMDENGKPRFRAVNLENIVIDYCEEADFSDAAFIGEAIYVNVADLVPYFTADKIKNICTAVAGMYGNPQTIDFTIQRYYNKFKVLALDLQFISFNTTVYENNNDKYGNQRFVKTEFKNLPKANKGGESEPVFMSHSKKVLYEAKWLVGTDYMYDYGIAKNQVRKFSSWWDTQYDYILYACDFYKMQFSGITEGLIPLADDYYYTRAKLQDLKNRLIPYMIGIDLNALENISYGENGKKYTPAQILDLLMQNYALIYRSQDLASANQQQQKPAFVEQTGMISQLASLRNELISIKEEMMEMSGYNAVTVGNPNPKMLNAGYQSAAMSTNDSLWLISETDRKLTLRLADLLLQKIQIGVKLGKIEGYTRALGNSMIKMFQLNTDISLHEFGIFLEDAATQQEWQMLIGQLNEFDQQGLLEPQDRIAIENIRNLKMAQMLLSYLVGKRKQEQQQNSLQMQQANAQTQMQSAQTAEQMKQQSLQMEYQLKMQLANAEGRWNYEIAALKSEGSKTEAQISAQAKIITQQIIEENKGKLKNVDRDVENKKIAQEQFLNTQNNMPLSPPQNN